MVYSESLDDIPLQLKNIDRHYALPMLTLQVCCTLTAFDFKGDLTAR